LEVNDGLHTLASVEEAGWAAESVSMTWRSEKILDLLGLKI
jgi:hypothetical protein